MASGEVGQRRAEPPTLGPGEREVQCAAEVPKTSPLNAPCPVDRFQNIPNRNVAKSGALTKPKTSCSRSMMLLKRVAT